MGGSGSGRWSGFGKPTTANFNWVDVRRFDRDGLLWGDRQFVWQWLRDGKVVSSINVRVYDGAVEFFYRRPNDDEGVCATADLERTPCHFGGERVWFLCPTCYRRCAKLYLGRQVGCRVCFDLAYESQREDCASRALRRSQSIRMRLGGSPDLSTPFPDKPKGMHWRTYLRLCEEADGAGLIWLGGIARKFEMLS